MKYILTLFIGLMCMTSCEKWTEIESKYEPESLPVGEGKSAEYYENLRAWKATMPYRKISWAWYGGWSGQGAYMYSSMAGLPDSLDIVALWGDWAETNMAFEARMKDLKYMQKVKGTKVVATDLIGNFDEERLKSYGWEGDIDPQGATVSMPAAGRLYTAELTPVQENAIRQYARWRGQQVLDFGYDGYDIDYEIGWGSQGTLVGYLERMKVYVDELSKMMGPLSGTDKLLIIDGAICNMPTPEMGLAFDYFVIQAYESSGFRNLNTGTNRFSGAVDRMKSVMSIDEIAKKVVMTENFEQGYSANGGVKHTSEFHGTVNSLLGMALWQPMYQDVRFERSGGCGVFHIEYEYTSTGRYSGYYPWIREAIQAMNPAKPDK